MSAADLPTGIWGGEQVVLEVGADQGILRLGCAEGRLAGPIRLDAKGRFAVDGVFQNSTGGPAVAGDTPKADKARYEGAVDGDRLLLTVRRGDTVEQYRLMRGLQAKVIRCY